jgi:hypothetical protein
MLTALTILALAMVGALGLFVLVLIALPYVIR